MGNVLRSQVDQRVRDALHAIVLNDATDEAYEVAEKAGYRELFPGCIYKFQGEQKMEIKTARAIITQARKDETYGGPMPEDDDTCLKEAEQLVDMAKQAWEQYIRGPEVEVILKLAANGSAPEAEEKPAESQPEEQTQQTQQTEEPATAPEPEGESEEVAPDGEKAPEIDVGEIDPQLLKIEPWEGYNEDRVKDITEGINIALDAEENPRDLLTHVYVYESAHKGRVRILKHVKEAWERIGGKSDGQTPETPVEREPEPEAESAQATGDEEQAETPPVPESVEQGESEHEELPHQPEGGGESEKAPTDAVSQSDGEAPKSSEEDRPAQHEAESPQQDRAYATLIEAVERGLRNERVDIPKAPPTDDLPELPWKWADISDADLHDFLMQFSAMAYYKSYVYSREERIAMHCKEAADELTNKLLLRAEKYDEKGKQKSVTLLEAEISQDENVKKWRRLHHKHEQFAQAAKREMESYYKMVESLSRLESMRHQAWERARR